MTYSEPARTTTRRIPRILVVGLLVVIAAIGAAIQLLASSSSTAASPIDVLRTEHRGALGEADGAVPDGTTVFDDEIPGVANLDPALLGALRRAATDAAADGVEFFVNSGWRSPKYQEQLLREAIPKYGSDKEAARWVATPKASPHVSGDAVDIGPFDAAAWLSEHGAKYGLCQIYGNELWHYELRPEAIDHGCPPAYADPTHDPRMQRLPARSRSWRPVPVRREAMRRKNPSGRACPCLCRGPRMWVRAAVRHLSWPCATEACGEGPGARRARELPDSARR
jgi:D-alanyl-D-alanine carboxypeptidase